MQKINFEVTGKDLVNFIYEEVILGPITLYDILSAMFEVGASQILEVILDKNFDALGDIINNTYDRRCDPVRDLELVVGFERFDDSSATMKLRPLSGLNKNTLIDIDEIPIVNLLNLPVVIRENIYFTDAPGGTHYMLGLDLLRCITNSLGVIK